MFLESFRHLIEIEALKKQNQQNQLTIASENKRISDLEERRKKVVSENDNFLLEDKNLKLSETQNQIEDLTSRIAKLTSQLNSATTSQQEEAFNSQMKTAKAEVDKLEELYFTNLEKSEELQNSIKENNEFFQGSLATLEEIKKEVAAAVAREEEIITNRNKRINSLTEELLPALKNQYLELEKKFKPKSPVAYLIDKKCTACFVAADSTLRSSLEEGRSIECCPNCSRLLIPETAKIY